MFTRNEKNEGLDTFEGSGMTSLTVVEMGTAGQAMEAILGMADEIMEDVKRKAAKGKLYVFGNMLRPVAKADRSLRLNGNYWQLNDSYKLVYVMF